MVYMFIFFLLFFSTSFLFRFFFFSFRLLNNLVRKFYLFCFVLGIVKKDIYSVFNISIPVKIFSRNILDIFSFHIERGEVFIILHRHSHSVQIVEKKKKRRNTGCDTAVDSYHTRASRSLKGS